MESILCRVDEFMESGDLHDLCPKSLDSDDEVDLDSVNKSFDGCIASGITGNEDNTLSQNNNISDIPFNECLMRICFTVEKQLLIHLGQVCNDANAPFYLVNEITYLIQDECDKGVRLD